MRSSFFEFHVATTGLHTAKSAIQVANHNVANASTLGYSRQYAQISANDPLATHNSRGMVGTGSHVSGIGQIRSSFLDQKYWNEKAVLGEHSMKKAHLTNMEVIFNELSGTGISGSFDAFFESMQDLTTGADDASYRQNVLKTAESLAEFVNATGKSLQKQQGEINSEVATLVARINSLGTQIANLNDKIRTYEMDGSQANDLRDQRALLVDELSLYVNVRVEEKEMNEDFASGMYPDPEDRGKSDRRFSITINGYEFVDGMDVTKLEVVPRDVKHNPMDVDGLYDIQFTNGVTFNIDSSSLVGDLKGLIDVRDGTSIGADDYKGVPYYLEKLNSLVRTFARAMNEGLDHDGDPIENMTGHVDGFGKGSDTKSDIWFFTYKDDRGIEQDFGAGTYADMNCLNFQVNSKLEEDNDLLACSDVADGAGGESNNKVIHGFGDLANNQSLFREGRLADYVTSMTGELGTDLKQSKSFTENYTDVVTNIDSQRMQVSGVSLNEETMAVLQYQQMYQAASKMISVINEVYNVMINQMGV